ncbi:MAG: NAD-dependent epimerase/dehydratase family protein [Bacteroidales bacterium]|nr:NAD-dependent epimerase/dehydratase family protein [Bacteroidales bacterium]
MEKVLVTGGNGFIGSNLCKRLVNESYEVQVLVRKTSDLGFLSELPVKLFYGDITQPETLKEPVRGVKKVFHVAGLAADWGPYQLFENINFHGTQNIAKAASEAGVERFIYISTVAFHGFRTENMDEDSPVAEKLIPYAQTKWMAEKWLWDFANQTKMQISAVRPGNVYGPNDHTFISKYIDALLSGKFAEVNHGKSKTCPIFVENLIDIFMLAALEEKAAGNAYLATDGLDITWHEFNSALAKHLNLQLPKTSIPYSIAMAAAKLSFFFHGLLKLKKEPFLTPYRINNGGQDYHFSIKKLKSHFNYTPRVNLDNALNQTVAWYLSSKA